jgi:hypothetical protein
VAAPGNVRSRPNGSLRKEAQLDSGLREAL